jgi:DNA-binding transcriptional LysR family regulator
MTNPDWFIRANLKPRHFRMLVALDDLKHLGRVAQSLHVTQPAVSLALKDLEKGLGYKLFERTPKGMFPNAYGECLIKHARTVLASLTQARDELSALQSGASGKVTVGALPAMRSGLLPKALAMLKQKTPQTTVIIHEGSMESMLPELRRGAVDLIVGRLMIRNTSGDVSEETLYEGHNVVVAGRKHPLVRRKQLSWQQLAAFPWVLPPAGSLSREPLENVFQKNGIGMPADCVETMSIDVITGYLQLTNAIGLLSQVVARQYIEAGLLAQLPLSLPDPQRPIGVTWNRHKPLSAAVQSFMHCLRVSAQQLTA